MKSPLPLILACFLAPLLLAFHARAERADRDKPVHLEAAKVTVDDAKRVHVFEGNVVLTQGTLTIKSAKLVVTQDEEGFEKGVATGGENGVVRFRQKREGKDEWIEGEAERIEYDAKTERVEFFTRAKVKSGVDEVRGNYIFYDGLSEQYLVTAAPDAKPGSPAGRVQAVIQPKNTKKASTVDAASAAAANPPVTEKH